MYYNLTKLYRKLNDNYLHSQDAGHFETTLHDYSTNILLHMSSYVLPTLKCLSAYCNNA